MLTFSCTLITGFDIIQFMEASNYITKEYFDSEINTKFKVNFDSFEKKIDKKFDDLAILIGRGFADVDRKFIEQEKNLKEYMSEYFASKLDLYETETRINIRFDRLEDRVGKIEGHIGRMEIRFSHLDEIVLQDHTPRIKNLELAVGI